MPSKILWADRNIGATSETDYGLYFQWGATVGYKGAEAEAHSTLATWLPNGGSSSQDEKVIAAWISEHTTNSLLNSDVDAATINIGTEWRMPTQSDFVELFNYTTSEYTEINGIYGYKFTNTQDADKHIFLPASGYFQNSQLCFFNETGEYFSSTMYQSPFVWVADFDSNDKRDGYLTYHSCSIRAVYTAKQ